MRVDQALEFGHEDRERIYEHVEDHGPTTVEDLESALGLDPRGLRHHVAILRRDGYLEAHGGALRATFEQGTEETHREDDLEFVVRPARQEDLTGIVGAIRQVTEKGSYIVAESVADVVDHEEELLRHDEIEYRMFFVATVNDEVVGWAHLNGAELAKLDHTAELTVGVLEEYRSHGIGSHLLQRGLEWAASEGFEKIYQSVPATNDQAIEFLEDHGWETEAVREDHYRIGETYVDEVMMAVTL